MSSINLPWYGRTLPNYQINGIQVYGFWLYIFTKSSYDIFVFDLNRLAFFDNLESASNLSKDQSKSFHSSSTGGSKPKNENKKSKRGIQEMFEDSLV